MRKSVLFLALLVPVSGCAALNQLSAFVQPPRFEQVEGRNAEVRILRPGTASPLGGATVRLWTRVTNPNAFGVTLGTLGGTLFLEDSRAAAADFPLGLPLGAGQEHVIPIDLSISFADVPGLSAALRRATANEPVAYRLEGTIGVDAGRLGQPVFGPMTLVSGDLRVR